MKRQNRHPEIGDMVVQTDRDSRKKWVGIVYEIKKDKWNHGTAFLHWSPDDPPSYKKKYGIPCVNIHNLYGVYDIIKKS